MSAKKMLIIAIIVSALLSSSMASEASSAEPYLVAKAKVSGIQKSEKDQKVTGKWQNFGGVEPFVLNGERTMFFAQLHINCTKRPKYVKIRLARLLPDGKKDTTGTNTWSFTDETTKDWQGSLWWESKTEYPMMAQFKVVGGKCYSDQRQFKWWQP
jgi:hypothetical protein